MDYEKEIPFGAFDSELMHEEISIPEGFEAVIEGNKIILKKIEPEDERIREYLIRYIDNTMKSSELKSKLLAWLEKQGGQIGSDVKDYNSIDPYFAKPIDNVKPKFKVGDWIVNNISKDVFLIKSVNSGYCTLEDTKGNIYSPCLPFESDFHLWTIDDARDGDVLSYLTDEEDLWIMIYWSLYEPYEGHVHYHALLVNDNFSDKGTCCICINDLKPATKEQRELLFAKMKESGHKWNSEKKELEKIEQKQDAIIQINPSEYINDMGGNGCYLKNATQISAWNEEVQERQVSAEFINALGTMLNDGLPDRYLVSEERIKKSAELLFSIARKQLKNEKQEWSEEDEILRLRTIGALETCKIGSPTKCVDEQINWLKSLKNRVLPQPKQEWSEKDERILDALISSLINERFAGRLEFLKGIKVSSVIDWLKSLKEK